jgi:molybdopterin biosynthesis enzyme
MGGLDLVKPWLARRGQVLFGRVRTKPGKPMTFAVVDGTPVFALPGFPVSSLVSFEVFVRPALRRMAGHPDDRLSHPEWPVTAGHDITHATDRTEFQRAVVALEGGALVARTTGFQGSGRLLSLSGANALLRLPEGPGHTPAGARVRALVLGPVYPAAG